MTIVGLNVISTSDNTMAIHKLTARKVDSATAGTHEDGGGLRLVVSKTGAKKWVLRYTFNRKRRDMGLGGYPTRSLADARKEATFVRAMIVSGRDPRIELLKSSEQHKVSTFHSCAAQFIKSKRHEWSNKKHTKQWIATLRTYALPYIGSKPVDTITIDDIEGLLLPIWRSKTETAKRVQGRIENILDYAAAKKYKNDVNPARWNGTLNKILPTPSKVTRTRHHPAMPYQELPYFFSELIEKHSLSSKALQPLILTATRTSEILNATWNEVDIQNSIWTIPAARMKRRKEHRIPLSPFAVAIIESLPKVSENPYLFPGLKKNKPLSNMALLQLMRKMGYTKESEKEAYVPHGFRSSFRDWTGEETHYPRDVAEMALAHTIENKVEAAYRRKDLFEKRKKMMADWCDFVITRIPFKGDSN